MFKITGLIFQAFVIMLLLAYCLSGCKLAGVSIKVAPELAAQEDEIIQEVYDVVDFIREYYDLDRNAWEHGLQIHVEATNLGPCGEHCILEGIYYHQINRTYVWWNRGTCSNVLIHELLHRVSWLETKTNGMFDQGNDGSYYHNEAFEDYVYETETAWQKERGCK